MAALAAVVLVAAPRVAHARTGATTLRIAEYNIDCSDQGNNNAITAGTAGLPSVIQAIGQHHLNSDAQPVDVLLMTEMLDTNNNSIASSTGTAMMNALNAIYGPGTYAFDTTPDPTSGGTQFNGPSGLVYDTKTVKVVSVESLPMSGFPRSPMRYELQPIGYDSNQDFYIYVSHMKSGTGTSNENERNEEGEAIRADEATLPASASVIYTGDYNSNPPEPVWTTMTASGQGQANDPESFSSSTTWLSESTDGLEYRDDYELMTSNVLNHTGQISYEPGTFQVFGNNGTTPVNGDTNAVGNTALGDLSNRTTILNDMMQPYGSDHLPVVADYNVLPDNSTAIYGAQTISTSALNPSGTGLYWFDGNAPGNFTFTSGAVFTNAGSFTCDDDRNFTGSGSWQNTGFFGKENTTGTTDFQIPFTNSGTVQLSSGNLRFDAGLTSSGTINSTTTGALSANAATINSGGVVNVSNGTFSVNNTLTNNGAISVSSATLSATTIVLGTTSGNTGSLTLTSGTISVGTVLIGSNVGGVGYLGQSSGSVTAGPVRIAAASTLSISGGSFGAQNVDSAGIVSITGGTLAITGAGSLGAGSLGGSAVPLIISGPGVLDVGTSGMVIEYGSNPSPVGDLSFARTARNYPAGSIQRYAQTAINGLSWNGPGITSSYAENDPNGLTAVGVADENDLDNVYPSDYTVAGGGSGTWMGQPINDTNNVLVRMTWYGDGNLDGVVNRLDVSALSQGYNGIAGYVGWSDGDYTYSGDITKVDVSLLAQSYLFQGAPLGDAITSGQAQYLLALDPDMSPAVKADFESIAGTPEPTSVGILGATAIGLLGRRRRI
jgi:hypothetical protein